MMKALLEAAYEADGSISKLQAGLGLPSCVVATLISSAARNGFLSVDDERIVLSHSCSRALREENIDSFLRCQVGSKVCEFALDLASGLVHDYEWVLEHRKNVNGVNDYLLPRDIDVERVATRMKEMSLWELLQSSSKWQMSTKEDVNLRSVERIDRIDDVEVEEVIEIAVPMTENHAGEITRLMVHHDTPRSVVKSLNLKKPELFAIKYELKESTEKWTPTDATWLLDRVNWLWERVQDAPLKRTPSKVRAELARVALGELKVWKATWKEQKTAYSDISSIDVWAGPAESQGEELSKFMRRVHKSVVILTSFLNRKYVSWVAEILSNLPNNAHVLILYGHANQETPAKQNAEIQPYKAELMRHLRSDIVLTVGVTTKRTHEKIVVSDTSSCMLGSWNICSSNPKGEHFEVNVDVKSENIASELCSVLEADVSEEDSSFIKNLRGSLEKTNGEKGVALEQCIDWLTVMMENIASVTVDDEFAILRWKLWRHQLLGLRDLLWTYYDSPPATIVTTESLRDVFVQLIHSSNSSLLIATDRVNYNGLDASLMQHLFEKQRIIRIVWGMESPEWDLHDNHEVQEELDVAAETLQTVIKNGRGNVMTSLRPMLNHSKLLIVDENRVLISSSNFLARGMEPTEESSREIGILVESPLLARKLLGQFMLHSEQIRGRIELRQKIWQPWDLFELIREAVEEVWTDKEIKDHGRPDLVSFAVQSVFREYTPDGKIVGKKENQYRPTDALLNTRWEQCMKFFGKGRAGNSTSLDLPKNEEDFFDPTTYLEDLFYLPKYEEDFFTYAYEMIGIQRVLDMETYKYTIRPRSRATTSVPMPRFKGNWEQLPPLTDEGAVGELQVDTEEEIRGERLYNLRIGKERSEGSRDMDIESG